MRQDRSSHGFGEDGLPVFQIFSSREENTVSLGGMFLRFDCMRDCFCDEKIGLCVEVVCDEKEVARARGERERCAVHS